MDLFDLRIYPDDMLRQKCAPLETVTPLEDEILKKMLFAMHHYRGIGLAAPQVGILKRLIVADIGEGPVQLINPEIVWTKGTDEMSEGCLSIPGVQVAIERPTDIVVMGLTGKGKKAELGLKGLMARVIQHEIDHLNGKLIVDYQTADPNKLSDLKIQGEKRHGNQNTL